MVCPGNIMPAIKAANFGRPGIPFFIDCTHVNIHLSIYSRSEAGGNELKFSPDV